MCTVIGMSIEQKLEKIENKVDLIAAKLWLSDGDWKRKQTDEDIDLNELVCALWRGKWIIILTTTLMAVLSILYVLSVENIYKSEVLLAPAEENSGAAAARLGGGLGGIASLAGVRLGGIGDDKVTIAIEVLKSREFLTSFIERHNLLPTLLAATSWDKKENKLLYDSKLFDSAKGKWLVERNSATSSMPTLQDAYAEFRRVMSIARSDKTGLINLSVEHYSPYEAKRIVDLLVQDINLGVKRRDVAEAKSSIQYLSGQLEKTSVADMKKVFYELIEEQTKTVMFAEVREEYVFKTLDRAIVPENKIRPQRALICLLSVMFGCVGSMMLVLIRWFLGKER